MFQKSRSRQRVILKGHFLILALLLAGPDPALAHPGRPPEPHDIWTAWGWEPGLLVGLALSGAMYARGVVILWRRAGWGRSVPVWRALAFGSGLLALAIALLSPLDALGQALFSAHMGQHLVLVLVAAPLLVLGAPLVPFIWSLPKLARQAVGYGWHHAPLLRAGWQALSHPVTVWFLYAGALWVWHLPTLYQAALEDQAIHDVEHLCFLGTALLFWWVVIHPTGHRRLSYGGGILFIFTTALHSGALGALLTFAPTVLYPIYVPSTAAWGLTPLADQQLAGLLMWVPPGLVYLITALTLFGIWLKSIEEKVARRESRVAGAGS